MMQRISLLLLLLLIELCAAQSDTCSAPKPKCRKKGGICQPKGTDCAGKIWKGKNYCKEFKSCDCCEPLSDCSKDTKLPCRILKGKCIDKNAFCNGTEVINKAFCKQDKTCKCCFENCVCDPATCTYNNQDGRCSRHWLSDTKNVGPQQCKNGCECYIPDIHDNNCHNERKCERPDAEGEGYYPTGHCRKECHSDEVPSSEKCDINPLGSCNCCLRKKVKCPKPYCEAVYKNQLYEGICRVDECLSMETRADFCPDSNCNCCINATEVCDPERCTYKDIYRGACLREQPPHTVDVGNQGCKDGCNCYVNNTMCGPPCTSVSPSDCKCYNGPCPEGSCYHDTGLCKGCTCCRISECKPKNNLCQFPDFCVDKYDDNHKICPKGYAKVYNSCHKKSDKTNPPTSVDCDCCKSLACTPNGDRCSGKGAFCTNKLAICPKGYTTSNDCSQPVVVNGVWVASKLCKCCTPFAVEKLPDKLEVA